MMIRRKDRIVVLGMMTKMPVPGVVWQTVHYLVGLQRLGYDVYYVEAHGRTPSMLMTHPEDNGSFRAAAFLERVMHRFGLDGRWAFHALHADGQCWGMSAAQLRQQYDSAALILNLHGGTKPTPELVKAARLVLIDTDPVQMQLELAAGRTEAIEFYNAHGSHFTFGENYGNPDCKLPYLPAYPFLGTRQPVVLDFWETQVQHNQAAFTTVGNWKQIWRRMNFEGELYHWSKHLEFLKFLDLPALTGQSFELALAACSEDDRELLEGHGWHVVDALGVADDLDSYRSYVADSRAEFTVAKDQNIRLVSGWFSDRSATYLAAGRPVITQDTGFGNVLPTGRGLFSFSTIEDAHAAVMAVNADYIGHARAAAQVARDCFSHDVVLPRLLEACGLSPRRVRARMQPIEQKEPA